MRHDEPLLRDNVLLRQKTLIPIDLVKMHLPVSIAGYTDFYSSRQHAVNIGNMFRDKNNPLPPNWTHLPVGYDGRASSIVVSGVDFYRPCGQNYAESEEGAVYGPSRALDVEVEMGCFIGLASEQGQSISMARAPQHLFGMTLVNDWSARDIQKYEYVPLGPFLGKNFCTSISPWVVTLDALAPFRVKSPEQTPKPLHYLQRIEDWAIDIHLEFAIQAANMSSPHTISRMNYKDMYWDICQQLAHHTVNGCPMKTGDLLASGTISGEGEVAYGSMIELSKGGKKPIPLEDGTVRKFLQDGDTVIIRGFCQGKGYRVGFGEVRGTVLPAKVQEFCAVE